MDCGNCHVLAELASCTGLRLVAARAFDDLHLLHKVRLQTLHISCFLASLVPAVQRFAEDPQRTVRRVSLLLTGELVGSVSGALRGVHTLTLNCGLLTAALPVAVVDVLASPELEVLCLVHCNVDELLGLWTERTAPRLRVLHATEDPWRKGARAWVRRLSELRPDLEICPRHCRRTHYNH